MAKLAAHKQQVMTQYCLTHDRMVAHCLHRWPNIDTIIGTVFWDSLHARISIVKFNLEMDPISKHRLWLFKFTSPSDVNILKLLGVCHFDINIMAIFCFEHIGNNTILIYVLSNFAACCMLQKYTFTLSATKINILYKNKNKQQ